MRRVVLFTLLALALPTAALANSIPFFETGTFVRGSISRTSVGGLSHFLDTTMLGNMALVELKIPVLSSGCEGNSGSCTFANGTVIVKTPTSPFMTLFTGSMVNGMVFKTLGGADIFADVLPTSRVFPTGAFVNYFAKFSAAPSQTLIGEKALVGVPEPGTLCLLGTSVIGFAGIARRRLKLGR